MTRQNVPEPLAARAGGILNKLNTVSTLAEKERAEAEGRELFREIDRLEIIGKCLEPANAKQMGCAPV